ncbi:MAG: DUF190 domain-containing protein [Gammaproteobacteria bacterium]|nr:DUF190 domain-containing protein [Gammaproteobacteria bacterium]MCH9716082.1 DUF190 domain-containing protein [Gammaproteobacteria bacterium]MCH9763677.1 DUF190 domain-containing protein [Gammaproteobacteria bacterium]
MSLETTDITIARVYLTEGTETLDNVLDYLRDSAKLPGFSVFRAIRGLGDSGEHTASLIDVSLHLPLIIEFFDEEKIIHQIIDDLTQYVKPKHMVFWSAKANSVGANKKNTGIL